MYLGVTVEMMNCIKIDSSSWKIKTPKIARIIYLIKLVSLVSLVLSHIFLLDALLRADILLIKWPSTGKTIYIS